MTLPIITPEQRLSELRGARILVVGPFGVGKTSLLDHLDPNSTIYIDVENGGLAINDVPVPHVRPQTWPEIRDLIVRIAGPNRSFQPQEPYSQAHFDMCGGYLPGHERIRTVFFDTVTAATRLSHRWAAAQPECTTDRGRFDSRAAYGLHARETLLALHHLQGARGLNVILIGALETITDDYGRIEHRLQAEGQRVPREIHGIVDIVVTMNWIDFNDGKPVQRAFVCTSPNAWHFPAKDRSGRLDQLEPPHLGKLIAKALPPRANYKVEEHHRTEKNTQENQTSKTKTTIEAAPQSQNHKGDLI
jgi:AAA domain-containing protein